MYLIDTEKQMANDKPDDGFVGKPLASFVPSSTNVGAGFILSALLMVVGLAAIFSSLNGAHQAHWDLPFNVKKGWCWSAVIGFCAIGTVAIVGSILLALYSRRLISRRVEMFANGFHFISNSSSDIVRWSDVRLIRETLLKERPPILKGPAKLLLPQITSYRYTVIMATGKEYDFDGNSIKAIQQFGNLLRERAAALALSWETVEDKL